MRSLASATTSPPGAAARAVRAALSARSVEPRLGAGEALEEVGALMQRLALGAGPEAVGRIAGEHLAGGGKRLRARLALAAAEGLGVGRPDAVAWAAACELLHNATLVHDDLQDGDRTRRGRPTLWVQHGVAQAINAGDLLLMLPYLALDALEAPPSERWLLARAVAGHAVLAVRGQSGEPELVRQARPGWAAYRRVAVGKTGSFFQLPVEGAALLAGRGAAAAAECAAAFEHLGVLFQLQDDVLDLYGEKGRDGPGCDLREGKVSALVVEHLALHPAEAEGLMALLRLPRARTTRAQVHQALARFQSGGALAAVLGRIEDEARALLSHPALQEEPVLAELAAEAVGVLLAPVAHLRAEWAVEAGPRARERCG